MKVSKGLAKKQPRKTEDTIFPIISLWGYFRRSGAANYVVGCWIGPQFEFIQDIKSVLVTCKFNGDRINSNRENVETSTLDAQWHSDFLRR